MNKLNLNIVPVDLLEAYKKQVSKSLAVDFEKLHDSELSISTFSFYTSVSAVFSSKIEGENMELDTYIKHKRFGIEFKPDYTRKIDDLYNAYLFAGSNQLNEENIFKVHTILTKNILPEDKQGKIHTSLIYVTTNDDKIEYVAPVPFKVAGEMQKLYDDIETLLQTELAIEEVFFFAAMIHLVFVKIHPFEDGNGRSGRLLEKWFLSEKLGTKAWFIQSERNYYDHHQLYYDNIRVLGMEYETLNYSKALPFLLMLPEAVGK